MSKENLFAKAIASRKKASPLESTEPVQAIDPLEVSESIETDITANQSASTPSSKAPVETTSQTQKRGRGRPATGKRSNDDWIGRTYYIQRETDLDIEDELLKLKRQGIEVDKSELVDLLLSAWVKWQQGENIEIQISEITPRRKSEKKN
ncbi:MAG: hypothetical protein KME43_20960 [Myxacorys chilensis ATA2-1-KO14]|jgi:hypothetical protein|nr:hypothetical protein [Myxacorys chilensis ATA2-1-KO14]